MIDLKPKNKCYVIAGPTASGKTGLAVELAEKLKKPVVIINADSLQIYKGLPLLTACPDAGERYAFDHVLFEYLEPHVQCSVALWWELATSEIKKAFDAGITPIVVGGTGMYINALIKGLPNTPESNTEWREKAQKRLEEIGNDAFHEELKTFDPELAAMLAPGDSQRMMRGWEVFHSTGEKLSVWHKSKPVVQDFKISFDYIQIMPGRDFVYERCNKRFDLMMENGALEEVQNFIKQYGTQDFPVCKALGFKELKDYIEGIKTKEFALEEAKRKTRNYAKRQMTWQRNTMSIDNLKEHVNSYTQLEKPNIKLVNIS